MEPLTSLQKALPYSGETPPASEEASPSSKELAISSPSQSEAQPLLEPPKTGIANVPNELLSMICKLLIPINERDKWKSKLDTVETTKQIYILKDYNRMALRGFALSCKRHRKVALFHLRGSIVVPDFGSASHLVSILRRLHTSPVSTQHTQRLCISVSDNSSSFGSFRNVWTPFWAVGNVSKSLNSDRKMQDDCSFVTELAQASGRPVPALIPKYPSREAPRASWAALLGLLTVLTMDRLPNLRELTLSLPPMVAEEIVKTFGAASRATPAPALPTLEAIRIAFRAWSRSDDYVGFERLSSTAVASLLALGENVSELYLQDCNVSGAEYTRALGRLRSVTLKRVTLTADDLQRLFGGCQELTHFAFLARNATRPPESFLERRPMAPDIVAVLKKSSRTLRSLCIDTRYLGVDDVLQYETPLEMGVFECLEKLWIDIRSVDCPIGGYSRARRRTFFTTLPQTLRGLHLDGLAVGYGLLMNLREFADSLSWERHSLLTEVAAECLHHWAVREGREILQLFQSSGVTVLPHACKEPVLW